MITRSAMREITPLAAGDCFIVFTRVKEKFDLPLHYHDEYELNLILNGKGTKRLIGDDIGLVEYAEELVLVGPNLYHAWFKHTDISEITIQFHKDLFGDSLLKRNQLRFIKAMLENSQRGILFSREATQSLISRILTLNKKTGFDSALELLSILHDLSISTNMKMLSSPGFSTEDSHYNSRRIAKVFAYMNANYARHITLTEVSKIANMSEASFSRFIKRHTHTTFVDSLTDIKLGHASRMLIDTTYTVAEIAYKCGFNNISNFNRVFKRKKLCRPKEFRETYRKCNPIVI